VGHAVFEWVIAIAVLAVFVLNAFLLWRISEMLKTFVANSKATTDKLNSLLSEAHSMVGDARETLASLVTEARPAVRAIATTTSDITDLAYTQAVELRALMRDTVLMVRNQVERFDDVIRRTTDRIEATAETIQKQVLEPVRELHHLTVGIRRALTVLFAKSRKQVDQVYQDEELFI